MDSVVSLIASARADGVKIEVDGDDTRFGTIKRNEHWLNELRENKAAIRRHLLGLPETDPPPKEKSGKDKTPWSPRLLRMSDVDPRAVDWLWQGRIAAGRLSLLVGMPGVGKSYLTADMAARISRGTTWPDGALCRRGSVLLLTAEDDPADTIRPRLDAHDADVSRVHVLTGAYLHSDSDDADTMISLSDIDIIESALRQIDDCRLIVVDPIGSFLGGRTDANRDNEVRSVLAPVAKLAEKYGPAVLAIAHRRKVSAR